MKTITNLQCIKSKHSGNHPECLKLYLLDNQIRQIHRQNKSKTKRFTMHNSP